MNTPGQLELLSPAGDWDCLRAAVENGADAVYFGLNVGFNARVRATNFEVTDLPAVFRHLHLRGVRGYVTLNTLIFSDELPAAAELIQAVADAGADAVLVQDLGLARLIRHVRPDLPLHASTQMTLTSAGCVAAAAELGVERVVLPRELSIEDIRRLREQTSLGLEAFVHGALCVAYSGQCLTSESLGGRSANRGHCAQACRLPYQVVCDGRELDLGDVQYLLSPQDLAAYELLPRLIAAGVTAFKIEGRLKTAEYVANITQAYREAIDQAVRSGTVAIDQHRVREMELSFSRGFSTGWLAGCDHQALVTGISSAKRGVLLGEVVAATRRGVRVRLTARATHGAGVAGGDGVVFAGNRLRGDEQGGRVFAVYDCGADVAELVFGRDAIDLASLFPGQSVWKTDDPRLTARLRKTFQDGNRSHRRVRLRVSITARAGQPLRCRAVADNGAACEVAGTTNLPTAAKHPAEETALREQFARLGNTVYELAEFTADIHDGPLVPASALNDLRRAMVRALDAAVEQPRVAATAAPGGRWQDLVADVAGQRASAATSRPPILRLLCRSLSQLATALECGADNVYLDFADIREYGHGVELARQAQASVWLATPRIEKPGEEGLVRALAKHPADGILARNLSGLRYFAQAQRPVVADFSLNAANELTAAYLRQLGAARVTASYDLNREQLIGFAQAVPREWLEVVLHQHMPMFHMEHCVFCAVLSPGTNPTNCGRPCDLHQVELRDRLGLAHPLHADVGCRNTLFNATPQSGAEAVPELLRWGLRDFRLEFVREDAAEVRRTIDLYRRLLAGALRGDEVWRQLRALSRVGVTRGTLETRRDPLAIL